MNRFEEFLKERFGKVIPRNKEAILKNVKSVDNGETEVTVNLSEFYVYFPEHFLKAKLAFMAGNFQVLGFIAIVSDSGYGVLTIPALLTMTPASSRVVKIGDVEYYELMFLKDRTFIENNRLIIDPNLVYPIYNELLAKPNVPTYYEYEDILLSFSKLQKYAGLGLDRNNTTNEIIFATTTRDSTDAKTQYRHAIQTNPKAIPTFYGLRNVQLNVNNITTAIMGSYSDVGVDSMLIESPKRLDKYEELLRQ